MVRHDAASWQLDRFIDTTPLAPSTLAVYRRDLADLIQWSDRRGLASPDLLGRSDVRRYLALLTTRGLASATVARKVAAMRRYFGWALRQGIVTVDPASLPPGAEVEELEAIVAAASTRLADADMTVERCLVTAETTAADCVEQLFLDNALGIVIVGDFGDLVAATEVPLRNSTIVIGVGGSDLADGSVTLDVNPFAGSGEKQRNSVRSKEGQFDILVMNSAWLADVNGPVRRASRG